MKRDLKINQRQFGQSVIMNAKFIEKQLEKISPSIELSKRKTLKNVAAWLFDRVHGKVSHVIIKKTAEVVRIVSGTPDEIQVCVKKCMAKTGLCCCKQLQQLLKERKSLDTTMFHHHWYLEGPTVEQIAAGQLRLSSLLPPTVAQSRGRPRTNNPEEIQNNGSVEGTVIQRTIRKCSLCRNPGHTRRRCPFKEQLEQLVQQSSNNQ
ncbi:hypothetical protein P9112_006946 [Eukaryota sp. TZLM1-RC]